MTQCMSVQVKDDVDLILNSFCKPDTFTDSEKVSLCTSPLTLLDRAPYITVLVLINCFDCYHSGQHLLSMACKAQLLLWPLVSIATVISKLCMHCINRTVSRTGSQV